jgi:hypothetical protein
VFLELTAQFGRPVKNSFDFFRFLAPNGALRRTENPRVTGSIPALVTTSKSMILLWFRVSLADHPGPSMWTSPEANDSSGLVLQF